LLWVDDQGMARDVSTVGVQPWPIFLNPGLFAYSGIFSNYSQFSAFGLGSNAGRFSNFRARANANKPANQPPRCPT